MTYADLVAAALKSEKTAQPWYDRMKAIQHNRDAVAAEVKRCRAAHPGRALHEIEAYILKGESY
jgi:hypothetical protein